MGRDIIGSGDRELGTNLMRMFFYTLAQSDDLPRSILFMNAGVKLPAGDEQVTEHLKTLVEKGVEVLVLSLIHILLARDIAKKIEDELEYPGQIKVNMIRELSLIHISSPLPVRS